MKWALIILSFCLTILTLSSRYNGWIGYHPSSNMNLDWSLNLQKGHSRFGTYVLLGVFSSWQLWSYWKSHLHPIAYELLLKNVELALTKNRKSFLKINNDYKIISHFEWNRIVVQKTKIEPHFLIVEKIPIPFFISCIYLW